MFDVLLFECPDLHPTRTWPRVLKDTNKRWIRKYEFYCKLRIELVSESFECIKRFKFSRTWAAEGLLLGVSWKHSLKIQAIRSIWEWVDSVKSTRGFGRFPVRTSKITIALDHTSAASDGRTSGGRYSLVPTVNELSSFSLFKSIASPKSPSAQIMPRPAFKRILAGLISRWRIFFLWR